jgi:CheY-like chemotaxis protein
MPGSQLANRLRDLNYRVLTLDNAARLAATVQRETPLLLFVDLTTPGDVCETIAKLKAEPATNHLPVIAFAPDSDSAALAAAQKAGANFAVADTAIISHLPQLLEQALHLD